MKILIPLLLLPALWLGGCKNQQKNAGTQKDRSAGVQWSEVISGSYCGIDSERQELIRSQEQWTALWQEIQSTVDPVPPLPTVNFDEQVLLACFMGTRNSGGYEVLMGGIEKDGTTLKVKLIYVEPGKNCVATMALTQPYLVVAVEDAEAENATFTSEAQKRDCDK